MCNSYTGSWSGSAFWLERPKHKIFENSGRKDIIDIKLILETDVDKEYEIMLEKHL